MYVYLIAFHHNVRNILFIVPVCCTQKKKTLINYKEYDVVLSMHMPLPFCNIVGLVIRLMTARSVQFIFVPKWTKIVNLVKFPQAGCKISS